MRRFVTAILAVLCLISACPGYAGTWIDDDIYLFDDGEETGAGPGTGSSSGSYDGSFDMDTSGIKSSHQIKSDKYRSFNYLLYKPHGSGDNSHLPLIVVLHGSGEVGGSVSKLKHREPYKRLKSGAMVVNALVLMPQLPKGSWGKASAGLMRLINHIVSEYDCDTNRISITGHSLGGAGAVEMLLKYPNYFAAAAILSPSVNYKRRMGSIAHVPMRFYYGGKETKFADYAKAMNSKVQSLGGESEIICIKGEGHPIQHVWTDSQYELFAWMASKRIDNAVAYEPDPSEPDIVMFDEPEDVMIDDGTAFSMDDEFVMFDEPIDVGTDK